MAQRPRLWHHYQTDSEHDALRLKHELERDPKVGFVDRADDRIITKVDAARVQRAADSLGGMVVYPIEANRNRAAPLPVFSGLPKGFEGFSQGEHAPSIAEEPWRSHLPLRGAVPGDRVLVGRQKFDVVRAWSDYEVMAQKPGAKKKMFSVHQNGPVVEVRQQKGSPDTTMAMPVVLSAPYDQVRIEKGEGASNRADGETWVNPRAFEPRQRATPEYVEQVVDAIVRYVVRYDRRIGRQDARRLVAEHARLVDGYYDMISTGWGKPEDPDLVARVLLARAGAWEPPAPASTASPQPSAWDWEKHQQRPPSPPTPYRLRAIEEMVKLGAHPDLAAQIVDFLEIDGPRTGAHKTAKQAARWGLAMQRRIAAAGGL